MKDRWTYPIFITSLTLIINIGLANVSINLLIIYNALFTGYMAHRVWEMYLKTKNNK